MSLTTIKAIWPGEKVKDIEELSNSHGSGPIVWGSMCNYYYGGKEHHYMLDGTLEKLWPRWKDPSIPEYRRAVLMMTYDWAYISKKDYKRAADDIGKFFNDFPANPERVNHWPRIKELFERDPNIPAIGFHLTSVSEDPFEGPWNEEKEEYDPPNWERCFDVYCEIDGLKDVKSK